VEIINYLNFKGIKIINDFGFNLLLKLRLMLLTLKSKYMLIEFEFEILNRQKKYDNKIWI